MFIPLLKWLNDTLLPAKWLGLYGSLEEDLNSAWLQTELDPQATEELPVWLQNRGGLSVAKPA